jgi:ferritin-like metal-binding protein YciE
MNTYVSDMLALENHILQPLEHQMKNDAIASWPLAARAVNEALTRTRAHISALQSRLDALGGHAASPVKSGVASMLGVAAAAIDGVRKTQVSKDLRDDYAALCLGSAAYTMLHTTAMALGDMETAKLAQNHLADNATIVMRISGSLPAVVLQELSDEGVAVDASVSGEAERNVESAWNQGASRSSN